MAAPSLVIPVSLTLESFERGMASMGSKVDSAVGQMEQKFTSANLGAGEAIERFGRSAEASASKVGNSLGVLIAGGIVAAVTGIGAGLLATIENLAKFGDKADEMRLPVNLMQALTVAAAEARVPVSDLTDAMENFTRVSKKGGDDATKLDEAFTRVGASFQKAFANAPTQSERLRVFSDAMKAADTEAKRAQLSLQVLGTENTRLMSIFTGGRSAIEDHIEKMRDLGLTVDETLVEQAKKARSEIALLSEVMTNKMAPAFASVFRAILPLLPPLEQLAFLVASTIGAFHTADATKPTATLEAELTALNRRIVEMEQTADDIRNKRVAPGDSLRDYLRDMIWGEGFAKENMNAELEQLDKDIAGAKARIKEVDRLISERQGKSGVQGAPEQGAFERRTPLGGGAATQADRLTSATQSVEKRTAALEAETKAIDDGTAARNRARVQEELWTVAQQVHGKDAEKHRAEIERLATAYGEAAAKMEQARAPLATLARDSANFGRAMNEFAASSLNSFTNELTGVITGATKAQEAFKRLADSIISDLIRIALKRAIIGPIAGSLNSMFPVVGGGGAAIFAPGMMAGGPVSAGTPYMVGERGPELFVPSSMGNIVPNGSIGGTTFAPVTNIDARGSTMSEAQFKAILAANNRQMLQAVNQAAPARQRRMAMLGT